MMAAENTAKTVNGRCVQRHYFEIVKPKKEDTRTANEIIQHMKLKISESGGELK